MHESTTQPGDERDEHPPDELSKRTVFAVLGAMAALMIAVTVIAVIVAGSGGAQSRSDATSTHGMVAPLELSTVSTPIAAHYRYAKAHITEYQQIPCWCGCQQFLAHRNLADCFVRADGKGWEAHAAGCGVCNGEAAIAERMLGEGRTASDVKTAVDTQFGTTAITTPPAST